MMKNNDKNERHVYDLSINASKGFYQNKHIEYGFNTIFNFDKKPKIDFKIIDNYVEYDVHEMRKDWINVGDQIRRAEKKWCKSRA